MAGDQVKSAPTAFSYDQKAIQILYNGAQYPQSEMPLFCTDSHAYYYNDCLVWDSGINPLGCSIQEFKDRQALVAKRLASQIVHWSTHPRTQGKSIDKIWMYPESCRGT